MPQNAEQREELSFEVKMLCSLLARIIYRCLKERDARLLAALKGSKCDGSEGEDDAAKSEDTSNQSV